MASEVICETTDLPAQQACAVPFRRGKSAIQFCVVTSSRGRWLFPKGFIEPGCTPSETALREAYEEAGLHGQIVGDPLGFYQAQKNGGKVGLVAMLMQVDHSDRDWPEERSRRRRWLTPRQARKSLTDPNLREMLDVALARLADVMSDVVHS